MKMNIFLTLVIVYALTLPTFAQKRTIVQKLVNTSIQETFDNSQVLPIKRVILYSNGVAYIERRGIISGNTEINLSFKQSQVDDVLKSMVVLDLGKGRIGAVSYNSSLPASARTAEIPFSVNAQSTNTGGIAGVLAQLQGAKVSVGTKTGVAIGSILTVEKRSIIVENNKPPVNTQFLVIASENGELTNFDLNEVKSIKLLEEGTRKDINEFANATASTRRRDAKTITVTSQGSGQREMIVSYTIAAPIWKTTYRVVLDDAGKPFFQGWAIVDNVSEEDWQNVQLSLISGVPISFIQPIQKPMYRYRPVVPIPQELNLQPQVYEDGVSSSDSIRGTIVDSQGAVIPNASITIINNANGQRTYARTDGNGNFSQSGLPSGNYSISIESNGFKKTNVSNVKLGSNLNINLEVGNVAETVDVSSESEAVLNTTNGSIGNTLTSKQIMQLPLNARNTQNLLSLQAGSSNNFMVDGFASTTTVSDALSNNRGGIQTAATGEEIGDLFEYKIEQPVTVLRDRSALIPIIQIKMDGERVAIYNEGVRRDRPMGGMLLNNTSNLTFEGGSLTVIDRDAYAGEALMERLKPKEKRLISFALDLGTLVTTETKIDKEANRLIKIINGTFQIHYFQNNKKIYHVSNQTDKIKTLYVEYPIQSGWELSPETPKPEITTQRYYRFRLELKPFEKNDLVIVERQPLMDSFQLTSLTSRDLDLFLTLRYIDANTKSRLEKLIDLRMQINQVSAKLQGLDNEENKISEDQKRLRENIETLSKTPEAKTLITRYIEKVNQQETRLEQMQKDRQNLEAEKQKLENDLRQEINNFELK